MDRVERETAKIKTLRAKVRYDRVQELQGDEQRRFGKLLFVAGPPAKFAVHFHLIIADDAPRKLDRWIIFDGEWLVERDNFGKKFVKTQVAPPDAKKPRVDPLALGEGPFAMPIGAKKELILKRFNVKLVDPDEEEDPPDTVHLRLTAWPERDIEYDRIDLWYSRKTLLPVRASTRQTGSRDKHIFHLMGEPKVNGKTTADEIDTSAPKGRGWHVEVTPWEEPEKPAGR